MKLSILTLCNTVFLKMLKSSRIICKPVDNCTFLLGSVPDWYMTQEMCDKVFSKETFMLKKCHDILDPRNVW